MFEFLRSKGDRRGEQVIFSDFKYHLQKMLKSKNLLQFNIKNNLTVFYSIHSLTVGGQNVQQSSYNGF